MRQGSPKVMDTRRHLPLPTVFPCTDVTLYPRTYLCCLCSGFIKFADPADAEKVLRPAWACRPCRYEVCFWAVQDHGWR